MSEQFIVFSAGERVADIDVHTDGLQIDIEYREDNNGRGAKLRERVTVDADGIPLSWEVDGTSLMGGAVRERLATADGVRSWTSQADVGQQPADEHAVYVANDTSPYAAAIYMRAALAADGSVPLLPSGRATARHLRTVPFGGATADAYVLTGVSLQPEFVLLDTERRLLAKFGGMRPEVLVRAEHADERGMLAALDRELSTAHLTGVQQRIRHTFDVPVRVRNVRVYDPHTLRLTEPSSVVFFRGRITLVEPDVAAAAGEVEIDGAGGTLMAGLHDMHTHISAGTGPFHLAAGVTTVRDMGNHNALLLDLIPQMDSGQLPGPSIVPSGLIEGISPHSARTGVRPESLEDALDAVRWYADRGYHRIKIYNSVDPAWAAPIAAEARRLGMRVSGHIPAFTTPDRMIEAGFDEITHINQLLLGWLLDEDADTRTPLRLTAMARARELDLDSARVRHTLDLMRERGVGLDTTTIILERLMLSRAGQVPVCDAAYLDHLPVKFQRSRRRTFVPAPGEDELRAYDESFPVLLQLMALVHEAGIPLWPGTDEGIGFGLHRELELYVAAGIPAAQVLRMVTLDCAEHVDRGHESGSVARGKNADLILIDGDPTADISTIRQIRMVVKGGDVYFPAEIYRELDITPFAEPPAVGNVAGAAR